MEARVREIVRLVERLGGHPAGELGLELDEASGVAGWLLAACLLSGRSGRIDEDRACDAFRALAERELTALPALAQAEPSRVEEALASARYPNAPQTVATLLRLARAVVDRHGGDLPGMAAGALGTEELGTELAGLAPGFGAAGVARFLRPLRELWPAAREVPLTPAARAAAVHLGLLAEGEDEEGEPGALRRLLAHLAEAPSLRDVEAALERLGARSCLRERPQRCPLGSDCPRRTVTGG